jgi:hypothetical protein
VQHGSWFVFRQEADPAVEEVTGVIILTGVTAIIAARIRMLDWEINGMTKEGGGRGKEKSEILPQGTSDVCDQ